MATYINDRGTAGMPAHAHPVKLVSEILDFANLKLTAGTDITPGSSDVYRVLNVGAGQVVLMAGVDVLTAETTNTNTEVALADGSVTYVTAATVSSTGSMTGVDAIGEVGVSFDAANTLDITSSVAAPTDAKLRVWAVIADFTSPDVTQRAEFTT